MKGCPVLLSYRGQPCTTTRGSAPYVVGHPLTQPAPIASCDREPTVTHPPDRQHCAHRSPQARQARGDLSTYRVGGPNRRRDPQADGLRHQRPGRLHVVVAIGATGCPLSPPARRDCATLPAGSPPKRRRPASLRGRWSKPGEPAGKVAPGTAGQRGRWFAPFRGNIADGPPAGGTDARPGGQHGC